MASSFAALRAQQGNTLEKIKEKLDSMKGGFKDPTLDDDTFWDPSHVRGKDGTGEAIVRFLPAAEGEEHPFVKYVEYVVQGKNGWYINRSRKSLDKNERDPAYEYNGEIFKKYKDKDELKKHLLKRNEHTVAQIYVISDPNAPENEGKVFKWKFGPQIWNIINSAMFPEFKTTAAINPFDPFDGADFYFRVYTKKIPGKDGNLVEVPSYEKSTFGQPRKLMSEEEFDRVWNQQYQLAPIVAPDQFKSYEKLKEEFDRAMGFGAQSFLDTDEPLNKASAKSGTTKQAKQTNEKSFSQQIDDEIPFDRLDTKVTAPEFQSNDDDDWFNQLKG